MLKSIVQVLPFGNDSNPIAAGALYICNSGVHNSAGEYTYIAGYFEPPCAFNKFSQVERYKVFQFDRNKGLRSLMQELWYDFDYDSFSFDDAYIQTYWLEHVLVMQQRATKDGCYA